MLNYLRNLLRKPRKDQEIQDLRELYGKFGLMINTVPVHLTQRKLNERIEFMQEELDEFSRAALSQDLVAQADALIDLVSVAKGTAIMLGLPWEQLWDEVHRSNLTKERGVGPRGHAADLVKGDEYLKPVLFPILHYAGYERSDFTLFNNDICDDICVDDEKPTTLSPEVMGKGYKMGDPGHLFDNHPKINADHLTFPTVPGDVIRDDLLNFHDRVFDFPIGVNIRPTITDDDIDALTLSLRAANSQYTPPELHGKVFDLTTFPEAPIQIKAAPSLELYDKVQRAAHFIPAPLNHLLKPKGSDDAKDD